MNQTANYAEQIEQLRRRWEALAKEAWQRGREALAAGDAANAARWLERARRLAPKDPTATLTLATVWLQQGRAEAGALFEELARQHDVRAAWLGLAASRSAAGDAAGAARALARTLSGQAGQVDAPLRRLADAVAAASGAPGWCALAGDGTLYLGFGAAPPQRPAGAEVALEGNVLGGRVLGGRVLRASERRPNLRLPRGWERAARISVTIGGRALLGSPLDLPLLRRTEGYVACRDGALEGWAWHPADPETDPLLRIVPPGGGCGFTLLATDAAMDAPPEQPLARPRRFRIAAADLAGLPGPVHVLDRAGNDLLGSPLDPLAERLSAHALARAVTRRFPADGRRRPAPAVPEQAPTPVDAAGAAPPPRSAAPLRRRKATIVVAVFRGREATQKCLDQVLATVPRGTRVVVVDDAGPEPELAAALDRLAARGRIRLLRHARNRGFPASANAGLRAVSGTDMVLLNSDTLVAEGWLERLADAAYAAADIGTATPFSNDASILSYPAVAGGNAVPDLAATRRLAMLAHRANGGKIVEIPTAVGFCMYIRRDCLDDVGLLREDVFAQGYGEENDFCLRARHLGWRHVAAPGVFVCHLGSQSFGAARAHLMTRNLAVLNRLHPGYDRLIAAHNERDPLAEARRRLDMQRWRAARPRKNGAAVLLITHDQGGGVQRQVEARIAALRAEGRRPIVLRPVLLPSEPGYAGLCLLDDGFADAYPNLRFALPRELGHLVRLLRGDRPVRAELHHLFGHDHAVLDVCRRLDVPYDAYIHDYAWFCPRISLLGPDNRYCGEPGVAQCEACVADAGRNIAEDIPVAALRRRSADDLARARRVIAPSADAAARIGRHFCGVAPKIVPWEADEPAPARASPPAADGERRICLVGAIGPQKGYDVLLACARDAAERGLPLRFIVVGHTIDDARLLQTGRVFVTGEYREAEAVSLIAAQQAHLAWLPSIWPETWCFALTQAWRAGLPVAAFDIGAQAERIRRSGRGFLLPLGAPPAVVNNALMAAPAAAAGHGGGKKRPANAEFTICMRPAITIRDRRSSSHPLAD